VPPRRADAPNHKFLATGLIKWPTWITLSESYFQFEVTIVRNGCRQRSRTLWPQTTKKFRKIRSPTSQKHRPKTISGLCLQTIISKSIIPAVQIHLKMTSPTTRPTYWQCRISMLAWLRVVHEYDISYTSMFYEKKHAKILKTDFRSRLGAWFRGQHNSKNWLWPVEEKQWPIRYRPQQVHIEARIIIFLEANFCQDAYSSQTLSVSVLVTWLVYSEKCLFQLKSLNVPSTQQQLSLLLYIMWLMGAQLIKIKFLILRTQIMAL
jgi:hypothetical protein